MRTCRLSFVFFTIALLAGCGGKNQGNNLVGVTGNSGCGATPVVAESNNGGCRIRLVSPKPCEEIDLSGGKSYEFAWTTDGTNCETPYIARIGGNPLNAETEENVNSWQLNAVLGRVSNTGGVAKLNAAYVANIQSSDGTFHWLVSSYYGSHPASVAFRIKR